MSRFQETTNINNARERLNLLSENSMAERYQIGITADGSLGYVPKAQQDPRQTSNTPSQGSEAQQYFAALEQAGMAGRYSIGMKEDGSLGYTGATHAKQHTGRSTPTGSGSCGDTGFQTNMHHHGMGLL